jgi:hypothetical protein
MSGVYPKGAVVDSQLGKKKVDSVGAPISGVRMDVSKAYAGVPGLLRKVINESDIATEQKQRILTLDMVELQDCSRGLPKRMMLGLR